MKIYQLNNIKQCPYKAYVSSFNLKTMTNKNGMIRSIYKEILLRNDFLSLSKSNLKELILSLLEDKYFVTKQEKQVEFEYIYSYIKRYAVYEKKLNRRLLSKNINGFIEVGDEKIQVDIDAVYDNGNNIELIKYKANATELSYKARTEDNKPQNNIELFIMKRLGEKIYEKFKKPIIASFYHMRGKSEDKTVLEDYIKDESILVEKINKLELLNPTEKKEIKEVQKEIKLLKDVLYFNNTEGNNIITFDYNIDLSKDILKLINVELNSNSEKCKSNDCEVCRYSNLCNYEPVKKEFEQVKELKKSSGEVKLTEDQKKVVYDTHKGIYRIIACPGAGKSSVMVLRTIELFKKGYSAKDVLMITFTNKGAEELREKIGYWLNFYNIKDIKTSELNIYTFNSFGMSIIEKEWEELGYSSKPNLTTTIDVNDILRNLLEKYNNIEWLNYKNPLINFPHIQGVLIQLKNYFNKIKSFAYNQDEFIREVLAKEKCGTDKEIKASTIYYMYEEFNEILKRNNLVQYQEQISLLVKLFKKSNVFIEKYGFKHIVVDEYQDTNYTQVELLQMFKRHKNFTSLVVVGDEDQSIFSFNNTTPQNILDFENDFSTPNESVNSIFMVDNFRSTPEICNTANKLISLNEKRLGKSIIGRKANGNLPILIKSNTLKDEYSYIAGKINEYINDSVPYHEIAFIARTKKELLNMQNILNENNIPNIIEVSELFIENQNVKLIISLSKFFRDMSKKYHLMEFYSIVNNTILDNDVIENMAIKIKDDLEKIDNKNYDNELTTKEEAKLKYFFELISPLKEIDEVTKVFVENLIKKNFHTFNDMLTYLYKIDLYGDDTAIQKDDIKYEAIVLTTAHGSKGREWKVVFNSINKYKYEELKDNQESFEEELRLLFVSLTRAKDELYITINTNQDKSRGKGKYCLFADKLEDVDILEICEE